jgi:hypothetical protein
MGTGGRQMLSFRPLSPSRHARDACVFSPKPSLILTGTRSVRIAQLWAFKGLSGVNDALKKAYGSRESLKFDTNGFHMQGLSGSQLEAPPTQSLMFLSQLDVSLALVAFLRSVLPLLSLTFRSLLCCIALVLALPSSSTIPRQAS